MHSPLHPGPFLHQDPSQAARLSALAALCRQAGFYILRLGLYLLRRRGSGLLFLLVVASVLATVGFSLAGSVLYETWRGQRLDRAEHVEEAALASLHKAIANLAYHPDYHEAFGEDWPNATHSSLTFATGALPYSTNNLGQDTATTGFGGVVVPAHCAHLVAVAECGITRQAYACILHIPKYPYAIASSGPLKTRGDFWVGALRDADKVPDPLSEESVLSADLACRSSANPSIDLEGKVTISGSLVTPGTVFKPQALVRGGVIVKTPAIPKLDIHEFDTQGKPFLKKVGPNEEGLATGGWSRADHGLTVGQGGLTLRSAVLYVDGDLRLQGPLTGIGAIFVNGNVFVEQSADLSSEQNLAICCTGDLSLRGHGQSSVVQGLLYSQGSFVAENLTLIGAFVANSGSAEKTCTMDNVHVLQSSKGQAFSFDYPLLAFDPNLPVGRSSGARIKGAAKDFFNPNLHGAGKGGFDPARADAAHVPMAWGTRTFASAQEGEDYMIIAARDVPTGYSRWADYFTQRQAEAMSNLRGQLADLDQQYVNSHEAGLSKGHFSLDLNRFIAQESRPRLLLGYQKLDWR